MSWIEALKKYNEGQKWSIPKKGSPEYEKVIEIKNKLALADGEKKPKAPKTSKVEKKAKVEKKSKAPTKKQSEFKKMEIITPKHVIDFNLLVTLKNEQKGSGMIDQKALGALNPFMSIIEQTLVKDLVAGSGLSLYGSGNFKGKLKKLTGKDRKALNSLAKQNNLSMGEVLRNKTLDIIQNPMQALGKVFNASKALKSKADDTLDRNFKKLLTGDMSTMNRMLQSKSVGDFAAKELTNKVDSMVDLFKKRIPGLAENFVFGAGCNKPFKFSKKDINELNKAAEQCQCMTGAGIEDWFAKLAEDPVGNIKKLLNFQEANMGFKKLADTTTLPGTKPKRLFTLPWQT